MTFRVVDVQLSLLELHSLRLECSLQNIYRSTNAETPYAAEGIKLSYLKALTLKLKLHSRKPEAVKDTTIEHRGVT
jgi:hypothetical protein